MLQDSRGTLAVNRRIKSSLKAPAYERFYASHSALIQPYAYLPIEACDGDVGNDAKLKRQRNPSIDRTNSYDSKVCSMNWTNWLGVFSLEEACFCYVLIIHKKRTATNLFPLDSVNGCQNRSGSIQNGSVETVPERFCSVNKLLSTACSGPGWT